MYGMATTAHAIDGWSRVGLGWGSEPPHGLSARRPGRHRPRDCDGFGDPLWGDGGPSVCPRGQAGLRGGGPAVGDGQGGLSAGCEASCQRVCPVVGPVRGVIPVIRGSGPVLGGDGVWGNDPVWRGARCRKLPGAGAARAGPPVHLNDGAGRDDGVRRYGRCV